MTYEIPADTKMHLKLGTPLAVMLAGVLLIAHSAGPGYAVAAGSIALGIGVELYQRIRNEGVASWGDAAASAAAGVVGGLSFEAWRFAQGMV